MKEAAAAASGVNVITSWREAVQENGEVPFV